MPLTILLQFMAFVCGYLVPLFTADVGYTPTIDDTTGPSGVSHYQLLGPGRAQFTAIVYSSAFPILNTTTPVNGTGPTSVQATSYSYSTTPDMRHYSALVHVTGFRYSSSRESEWVSGLGEKETLPYPGSAMAIVYLTGLACLTASWVPLLYALVSNCCRPYQPDPQRPPRALLGLTAVTAWTLMWGVLETVSVWAWARGSGFEHVEMEAMAYLWAIFVGLTALVLGPVLVGEWRLWRAEAREDRAKVEAGAVDASSPPVAQREGREEGVRAPLLC